VAADVVYFAQFRDPLGSGDIRVAVIQAEGTGYRVVLGLPRPGDYASADYIYSLDECQAHIASARPRLCRGLCAAS
jgi:hypothetical protein